MKPQRLVEKASSQSICLFCSHRLLNSTLPRSAAVPRRSFVRAAWTHQHAGEAVARTSFPDSEVPQSALSRRNEPTQDAQQKRADNHGATGSVEDTGGIQRSKTKEDGSRNQWNHLRRRNPREGLIRKFDHGSPSQDENYQSDFNTRREKARAKFVGLRQPTNQASSVDAGETKILNERRVRWTSEEGNHHRNTQTQDETGSKKGFSISYSHNGSNPVRYDSQSESGPRRPAEQERTTPQTHKSQTFQPPERRPQRTWIPDNPGAGSQPTATVSSTVDAMPRKRGNERQPTRSDRRAEKFDFTGAAEQSAEDAKARAQKELKKQRKREKIEAARVAQEKTIELPAFISVANLAALLRVRVETFVAKLEELGFEEVANDHVLNFENASLVAMEYDYQPAMDRSDIEDLKPRPAPADMSSLPERPPVITIMGHVDHGKTTLLDFLRKSSVAAQEHGGITQHIGAFSVPMSSGKLITFLDTPGHAAFLSMRQRGAHVTDIVILVVAADDSVKPQTIEAIKHAKAAKVPIIVAINKIDKDEANIDRVKQDLLRHEVEVEDFGGDVQAYPVSGKTGEGLEDLVEAMVTQAEILDMRAEIDGPAEGWVLEATTKKAGRIATVLVKRGTLRPGDIIVAGNTWARIRTLKNEAGLQVDEAPPGTPVEVDGWRDQPIAGDEVLQAPSEQKASSVVAYRDSRLEQTQAAKDMEAINENRRLEMDKRQREKEEREAKENDGKNTSRYARAETKNTEAAASENLELYFIVKADVSGSAEAIEDSIAALPLSNHPINLNVIRAAVGPVTESDIDHAAAVPAGEGFVVSFNQQIPPNISAQAEQAGVRILDENIIYKVIDAARGIVESKLPPVITKRVLGEAEVAQIFEINTGGRNFTKVAGCRIRNGVITKNKKIRVYRGNAGDEESLIFDGNLSTLKSQKKDVQEMRKGTECGMGFEKWEDFKSGDIIQCYEEKSEPRRLI